MKFLSFSQVNKGIEFDGFNSRKTKNDDLKFLI